MKWFRIEKEKGEQPQSGSYKDWKEMLAVEGRHQCVYCAIPEASFGGLRNFHVEHYKPKSKEEFKHLENDVKNLFYACPICNTFKGDDWPCEPPDDLGVECYASPSVYDYTHLFLDATAAEVVGKNITARYMISQLYLNRPQLVMERRHKQVLATFQSTRKKMFQSAVMLMSYNDAKSKELLREYLYKKENIDDLMFEASNMIPYQNKDVSR